MKKSTTDLYINCDDLIKEANILYNLAKNKELYKDDLFYIESMNKYINSYEKFKEHQIKQYITDLEEYIKSNQIKSNQISLNQFVSNQFKSVCVKSV